MCKDLRTPHEEYCSAKTILFSLIHILRTQELIEKCVKTQVKLYQPYTVKWISFNWQIQSRSLGNMVYGTILLNTHSLSGNTTTAVSNIRHPRIYFFQMKHLLLLLNNIMRGRISIVIGDFYEECDYDTKQTPLQVYGVARIYLLKINFKSLT